MHVTDIQTQDCGKNSHRWQVHPDHVDETRGRRDEKEFVMKRADEDPQGDVVDSVLAPPCSSSLNSSLCSAFSSVTVLR